PLPAEGSIKALRLQPDCRRPLADVLPGVPLAGGGADEVEKWTLLRPLNLPRALEAGPTDGAQLGIALTHQKRATAQEGQLVSAVVDRVRPDLLLQDRANGMAVLLDQLPSGLAMATLADNVIGHLQKTQNLQRVESAV